MGRMRIFRRSVVLLGRGYAGVVRVMVVMMIAIVGLHMPASS